MSTHLETIIGMILLTIGQFILGTMETIVKLLFEHNVKLLQIMCMRFTIGAILSFIWWKFNQPINTTNWYGDSPYITNIWARGFFHFCMASTFFFALSLLPIGDTLCIFYHSPLLIVFAGHFVLNEPLPNRFLLLLSCILLSMGIMILSQPAFITNDENESLSITGIIFACIAAISWAFACILTRTAKESHVLQLEIANSLQTVFLWIPLLTTINHFWIGNETLGDLFGNDWIFDMYSSVMMCVVGVLGFAGLLFNTLGYQYSDATKVSWLEYIEIPILFGFQTILFNDPPNKYEIIGACMVTVGCLLPAAEELYHYYHNARILRYSHVQIVSTSMDENEECLDDEEVYLVEN
eukprot:96721_1